MKSNIAIKIENLSKDFSLHQSIIGEDGRTMLQ